MSQYSGLSATFKTEVKKKSNKPRVGIALLDVAKYYSRGKTFVMDGKTYADELSSAPSLSLSAKMTGGLSTVNKLNLDILNQDLVSDHFAEGGSYPNPENTAVKAYLVFDSGTTELSDSIQFFNGIIDDFPTIDYKSLKIACTSIDKITFKKIGDLITQSDAPSNYKVPEDSLGKIKPEIYGDHRFHINFTKDNSQLASNYSFNRENNVVEAISLGGGYFFIANHIVNSINSNGDGVWLYDDDLGRLVEVNDFSVVQNSASGCIISVTGITEVRSASDGSVAAISPWKFSGTTSFISDGVEAGQTLVIEDGNNVGEYTILSVAATYVYVFPLMSQADSGVNYRITKLPNFSDWRSPTGASTSNGWLNVSRIHDLSISSAAVATLTGVTSKKVTVTFDSFTIPQNRIKSSNVYIKGNYDDTAGEECDLMVNNLQANRFQDNTNTTQFHTHDGTLNMPFLNSVEILYNKDVSSGGTSTCNLYEVIQKNTYYKNVDIDNMKIYFGGLGREYGSWLTGRTNHQDVSSGAGSLIENAAGVVESIMRDIVGFSTINTASFDSASSGDLAASKLSFDISEKIDSDELIYAILERVKSLGSFNYNDEFKMIVYDSADYFTEAGSDTPNDDDKFLFTTTESGDYDDNTRQIDEHPIIKDSFTIRKNPANQIVTDFIVEYYKTHDGGFARTLTAATETTYHAEEISKTFSHPYTKDTATAQIWLTFLIDRLNRKHWTCELDTWYNAIGKELWDVVNIQHPVLESLVANYATKKWRILNIGINSDLGKVSLKLEEQ